MPAESKAQQSAAGMALAVKKGKLKKEDLRGAAKHMYESLTTKQLEEYAATPAKRLPKKTGRRTHYRRAIS
jgi:hypothetical protein